MFQERSPRSPLSSTRPLRRLKDPSSEGEGLQDPTERPLQCGRQHGRQASASQGFRCVRVCVCMCASAIIFHVRQRSAQDPDSAKRPAAVTCLVISRGCRSSEAARNWQRRSRRRQPSVHGPQNLQELRVEDLDRAHAGSRNRVVLGTVHHGLVPRCVCLSTGMHLLEITKT